MNTNKSKFGNQTCLVCDGNGFIVLEKDKCSSCEGRGWISYSDFKKLIALKNSWEREIRKNQESQKDIDENNNWNKSRVICSHCGGDGGATGQCFKCNGSGWEILK